MLSKISKFFDVPTDFLLGLPPFDCWDLINQNRKGFLYYVDIDSETLKLAWGYDFEDPDNIPTRDFISFIAEVIETAKPTEEGDWDITLRPLYKKEKMPSLESDGKESSNLSPAFFRLKQGLEPYDLTESDADFLLTVYKAHLKKNQQE